MNRNNTVSVINEVAATDDPTNSSVSRSNSLPPSENLSHAIPVPVDLNIPAAETAKLFNSQNASRVLLLERIEEIVFKQKMKEILICQVCTELRRCPMYQCKYGHLICAGCLNDILAESRLQNEIASCPNCQTTITKELCFRNVAVEKTISELPVTCPHCSVEYSPDYCRYHENVLCQNKPSECSNSIIGCSWQGPHCEKAHHEKDCKQPSANGYEILKSLQSVDQQQKEGATLYNKIIDLLSVEKISYIDLQLKQSKTENGNIILETSKFTAFENQWVIRACCQTEESKNINYQLLLESKLLSPMNLQYIILRGPFNDMDIKVKIYQFRFTDKATETPYQALDVPNAKDKEIFHKAKRINIRILMFIVK